MDTLYIYTVHNDFLEESSGVYNTLFRNKEDAIKEMAKDLADLRASLLKYQDEIEEVGHETDTTIIDAGGNAYMYSINEETVR